ncbi:alpha/beta hydrolase [Streptomyces sp. MUM 178J]|uniref:alpha/beta hydrolase n=1 Tax=Streptomyces sp. MUM 178J TaxID=2791991 RepID=UPI001F04888D|nr:alpha/beta hydrolase [Streptomyces sp. MUM 178J]WRQ81412.1 alpha/beta hydrolase [Streptomyces sp. MUM 178J]
MPTSSSAGRAAALAVAVSVLLAAGCSGDGGGGNDRDRAQDLASQELEWEACGPPSEEQGNGPAPSPLPGGAEWECSSMDVPLDYDDSGGDTVSLALIRARARDPDRRIGSLIFNFGGPGGSGVATLPGFAEDFETLRARYDLVSFDPRGVGDSAGVECLDDEQLQAYFAEDATPEDAAEEKEFVDGIEEFSDGCEERSGKELPYVGTVNAARDMDLMRQVLGDDKLYYFGISYGTELGGVYAHLYPRNVGRAVFDAAVDPTKNMEQGALGQARGFQLALDNFAQDCVNRGDDCLLPGATANEVVDGIIALLDRLREDPISGIGLRRLNETQAINGIAQTLYSKEFWPLLEQGLDEADAGSGALLLAFSDSLNGRNENGTYSNIQAANTAINCVDSSARYTLGQTKSKLPEFREASRVFGDTMGWALMSCSEWPVPGLAPTPDVSAPGAPPILVIGTTGDPATPYEGARAMAEALGDGVGVELTYEGEGHGAYNTGDTCVMRVVDAYLLEGAVPEDGAVCGGSL